MEEDLNFQDMEEDLNFKGMEDDLKFSGNIKQLKFSENGRLPQFNISCFFWLMWILNSQQKTICNSNNLNLA